MSFVGILKKVGTILVGVEHIAAPIVGVAFPALAGPIGLIDNVFQKLQNTIITVENNNPVTGQGQLKADAVVNDFNAGLDLTQQVLALKGEMLTYDSAALQESITSQVAAYNAMAKLKASFKVVAKSPA
jgi:hypothetical protein